MQSQTMQTKAGQDTGQPYKAKKSRTKQHNAKQCNPKQSLAKQSNANPSTGMQSKAIKSEEGAKKTNWCGIGGIWKKARVPNDIVWTFILYVLPYYLYNSSANLKVIKEHQFNSSEQPSLTHWSHTL